ncbi:hypothetical protein NG798_17395 [Ancylothrix sp. C2]|uniref:hypothetical protein n=1 Tax=Ancylothrix sp. D3o TaxID=2953691 RepID=UPI0021BAE2C9|nr:hypothetical protein [Ancylothrix sp. D3o]MCT7951582.1 hypothetical protein [Ancylothrix sp. D3o]
MKLTASNIVRAIGDLPRNRVYHYINPQTKGNIEIFNVVYPEGPIVIKRYDPAKGQSSLTAKEESISSQMIWRIANAFTPNYPIQFDRVLGSSYNTRSVLEALLAHTPQFYFCYPGRVEIINSSSQIKSGHKHLIWCPENPHELAIMREKKTQLVISEVPVEVVYDSLSFPESSIQKIDINVQRRHSQMQIALIMIGKQLGYRTWIAQNDRSILYNNQKIGEMETVIPSLKNEKLISIFEEARKVAQLIDCIWFKSDKFMPAVIEVEHTTGVTSGLTRMKNLQDALPPFQTRYVIVAPDEDREKVIKEGNRPQFHSLNIKYFPYSAVEELYALCHRRKLRGVTEEFLDCYIESVLAAS